MIRNDPQRMALRKSARALIIVAVCMVVLSVLSALLPSSGRAFLSSTLLFLVVIILFFSGFALLSYVFKKVDKRRALALQGDQSMLAAEQPEPDASALSLPVSIQLVPRRGFFYFFFGIILLGGIIGGVVAPIFSSTGRHARNVSSLTLLIIIAVSLAVVILLFALLFFILRSRMRYQINVDEQGISVSYNKITTRVDWNTARLFTVNGVKKPGRPKVYELANEDTLVRWLWVPSDAFPIFTLRPTIPQGEYDRQMHALLQVVEAKTHLPLYDISKSKVS